MKVATPALGQRLNRAPVAEALDQHDRARTAVGSHRAPRCDEGGTGVLRVRSRLPAHIPYVPNGGPGRAPNDRCAAFRQRPGRYHTRPMVTIATLAEHPQLVPAVVEIAWQEWGASLPEQERARWLREAELDSSLHAPTSAGFVALDGDRAVGVVQLHEFEIDAMRDRSPWVCGMVVRPEYRGAGVGSRLLAELERFAAGHRVPRLWVFTEQAAAFYQHCGWQRHCDAVEHGEPGVVLTRVPAGGDQLG
jgi:GNAT superfamily N-acetyltransferase